MPLLCASHVRRAYKFLSIMFNKYLHTLQPFSWVLAQYACRCVVRNLLGVLGCSLDLESFIMEGQPKSIYHHLYSWITLTCKCVYVYSVSYLLTLMFHSCGETQEANVFVEFDINFLSMLLSFLLCILGLFYSQMIS